MATRSFFLAVPFGASPAARFMPPTHRRDTPSHLVVGSCIVCGASSSSFSSKYRSCIFCGLTRMALPPAMVSAAVANSNSFPLGRGTSSRKSFFISLEGLGRGVCSRRAEARGDARRREGSGRGAREVCA